MARTLSPERQERVSHVLTLRRMGWTERAIAEEVGVPRRTVSDWLGKNGLSGIVAKEGVVATITDRGIVAKKPLFRSFLGRLEDFETDIRFPLIIADPPWNISVEGSMRFHFIDKKGQKHTKMVRNFGAWDFQGADAEYLGQVAVWLGKLFTLAAPVAWCWFWCSYRLLSHINNIGQSVGWEPKGWYLWAKTNVPPLTATLNGTLMHSLERRR